MIDVSWQEILVIAVVAVVVIGPKDLPVAIRTVAGWVKKAREMAGEFQRGVDEMVELHERLRRAADAIALPEIDFALARIASLTDRP